MRRPYSSGNIPKGQSRIIKALDEPPELVFLHASPNILKDFDASRNKEGWVVPDPLDFKKEAANIKQVLSMAKKKLTFRSSVATKMAF